MKNIWTKISLGLLLAIILQCSSGYRLNRMDVASLYDYREDELVKKMTVLAYHRDSISIHVELNSGQFLYNKDVSDSLLRYFARYKVEYDVFKGYNEEAPLDSGSFSRRIVNSKETNEPQIDIHFRQGMGQKTIVRMRIIDLNRKYYQLKVFEVDKTNLASSVFIQWKDERINYPNNWIRDTTEFHHTLLRDTILWLKSFSESKVIPPAPFSFDKAYRAPDKLSVQPVYVDKEGNGQVILTAGVGILETDTINDKGAILLKADEYYPEFRDVRQLLQPIQYLIDENSYAALIKMPNARYAFENFWLDKTGSKNRARRAIKNFYNKVTYANQFFSDYRQGWKTDRGMVYIMLGLPNDVQRSQNGEVWVYERGGQNDAEAFTFKKETVPGFGKILVLQRSKEYKIYWDGNIDRIFEGRP
jgi:GWxTD domain-containing protein